MTPIVALMTMKTALLMVMTGIFLKTSLDVFLNVEPDVHISRRRSVLSESDELELHAYLQRQGRNECINLASQIAYDGANFAFVFNENQICRLMEESPYDEWRLEVLRVSCAGQPREMVNLFCTPMKGLPRHNVLRRLWTVSGKNAAFRVVGLLNQK